MDVRMDLGTIIELISLGFAVVVFVLSSLAERRTTRDQTRKETIRATLTDFTQLKRDNKAFTENVASLDIEKKRLAVKYYLTDLERFAVGCNLGAYDLEVVNKMSGGNLVSLYRRYFRPYIGEARLDLPLTSTIRTETLYIEVENMMKRLYELRKLAPEPIPVPSEEERALWQFLNMRIDSPEEVFALFRNLPGVVEDHGGEKQGYLYVPGSREDRCLLIAHADTYFDSAYLGEGHENTLVLEKGVYHGVSGDCSIGADDRAGCAMLWILRDSGHSLLILDGEEHGQIGSNYLKESAPDLFQELNGHTFMLQLDRRGNNDYKCYDIPVSQAFLSYIEKETGFRKAEGKGRTDIMILSTEVCGVNISVGYSGEHTPEEKLTVKEWEHTLEIVRRMIGKPLIRFPTEPR